MVSKLNLKFMQEDHNRDLEKIVKNFRGDNGVRELKESDFANMLTDLFDLNLYSRTDAKITPSNTHDYVFHTNQDFWKDVLSRRTFETQVIRLNGFYLLEWLPASPGLYYTEKASIARKNAKEFFNWVNNEFLPLGKCEMVLGGVGSVRLSSKAIGGEDYYFLCATSSGISHQGVPLLVPRNIYENVMPELKENVSFLTNIVGRLKILPLEKSIVQYDRDVPKYFLLVEKLEVKTKQAPSESLVTVAITFPASYYSTKEIVAKNFITTYQKSWTFASFKPDKTELSLKSAVEWLEDYALRYSDGSKSSGTVPILSDFDEHYDHFHRPVEFSLEQIQNNTFDFNLLMQYCQYYQINLNTRQLSDQFGKTNATGSSEIKDVFICHASEDKRYFVEPLVRRLAESDISCWYDNAQIKWGDSIVRKVNEGLSTSRFVIVVLSNSSIQKRWPNYELESALNIELSHGVIKVLPVILGDDEEVKSIIAKYPILNSKLYKRYTDGNFDDIIDALRDRIQ